MAEVNFSLPQPQSDQTNQQFLALLQYVSALNWDLAVRMDKTERNSIVNSTPLTTPQAQG